MSRIRVGDKAPEFASLDTFGKKVVFSRRRRAHHTLVVFTRYASCPWCNLALHRLTLEYPLLKKNGCEVVVVVQSTVENIQKNIYGRHRTKPPFHIIPDHKNILYRLYHVTPRRPQAVAYMIKNLPYWVKSVFDGFPQQEVDGSFFIVPAFFLVDTRGEVVMADYSASFYDDATFTPIYEKLTFGV